MQCQEFLILFLSSRNGPQYVAALTVVSFGGIHDEELFPVLGEFVGVVGGQQLVFLERSKCALLDSCLENTLAIPFVRFLPQKGNPPRG
ncbi:hypothetical protein TNCV_2701631 [Trichonephila clavipes]|nr:hypothetical protein TNCV_2701631 [Trichonephila clavipes]